MSFASQQAVRFIGGKYNGFQGTTRWVGETLASVVIVFEGKEHEVVESTAWLQDLAEWRAGKSATELQLKGGA